MLFRKNRIKETPKRGMYGNRHTSSDISSWDSMSIIEKFCMVFLPVTLGFMFYIMLDIWFTTWWIKLLIAIGSVCGLIGLIIFIVNWFMGD